MATTFKTLTNNDITATRTLLHEAIPLTGSIVSGTYNLGQTLALGSAQNIKTYSHGMFQSVYDYPYLSSSANHIFDITLGYSNQSKLSGTANTQNTKKINLYNQLGQVLAGYDATGSILRFDEDGNVVTGGTKINECFFLNFSRLLNKDEIKKGSFSLQFGVHASFDQSRATTFDKLLTIQDSSGSDGYKVNSPAGEYGILFATGSNDAQGQVVKGAGKATESGLPCGLIYYQAGIAVISGSVFGEEADGGILNNSVGTNTIVAGAAATGYNSVTSSNIDTISNGVRNRFYNLSYNNTTELNSTIYFCRANHNDFNYSANPTYLSESKLRVKNVSTDSPVSYITTVGLYSADNELLAVAKLSEPLKKNPETELTLRVRLDY